MADLKQECAERKEARSVEALRKKLDSCKKKTTTLTKQALKLRRHHLRAIASKQSAERIGRAFTEAGDMDPDDHRLIRALDNEGIGMRDIAEKFETDILTVACVIEGVV